MKHSRYLLICIVFNISSVHIIEAVRKSKSKNMQLCLNNIPKNFGTTHFIVGYEQQQTSKKEKRQHVVTHRERLACNSASCLDKQRIAQSFFTTIHDLSPILLEIMAETQKRLYIAAFNLTDMRIVDYVKNAHKNGVDVCVITDASNMKHVHSKAQMLVNAGVSVWYYKPSLNPNYKKSGLSEPCMHHKMVVGDNFVVTGSANFTKAGQKTNIENIIILRDRQTIGEYYDEFERLKKYCIRCMPQTIE